MAYKYFDEEHGNRSGKIKSKSHYNPAMKSEEKGTEANLGGTPHITRSERCAKKKKIN